MIPKIIHYCWFGKGEIPANLKKCMASWHQELPDYQIIRWDESNFDVNKIVWTKEAYEVKKYAFVSDYVRLVALYNYGGIYLDTDVMVKKNLNEFLKYNGFMGFENSNYLTSAVMGFHKNSNLVKEFLDTYDDLHFINEDGSINNIANVKMMTEICKKHGLEINNLEQDLGIVHIFPKTYFCPLDFYMNKDFSKHTHTIHYFEASWLDDDVKKEALRDRKQITKMYYKILAILSKLYHRIKGD